MGVAAGVAAEDAVVVDQVDADLAVGVDDVPFVDEHPHVGDLLIFVVEKEEVARQGFVDQVDGIALGGLHGGIARDPDAAHLENQLHKARAVNPKRRATAPEVWGVEKKQGKFSKLGGPGRKLVIHCSQVLEYLSSNGEASPFVEIERASGPDGKAGIEGAVFDELDQVGADGQGAFLQIRIVGFRKQFNLVGADPSQVMVEKHPNLQPILLGINDLKQIAKHQLTDHLAPGVGF